jgi:hypothetical protein
MKKNFTFAILVSIFFLSKLAFSDDILKGFDAYKDKDYKSAFEIWHKLAEEGDSIAQNSLGVLFQKGQGVDKDFSLSYKWFKKSAEKGYTPAQVSLGYIYDQGMGISQNKIKAYMWWKIASLHGDSDAKTLLQILLSEIDQNDQLLANEKANKCLNSNFKKC